MLLKWEPERDLRPVQFPDEGGSHDLPRVRDGCSELGENLPRRHY